MELISHDEYAASEHIAAVASRRHNEAYGWSVICECFTAEDMVRLGFIVAGAPDMAAVEGYVSIVSDQFADATDNCQDW